jgi:CYTH domain-containing protein
VATEIERKFLVRHQGWRQRATALPVRQGYLCASPNNSVRVRTIGERAFLTVKSERVGCVREEFEYAIPLDDAQRLLATLCQRPLIEKTRYQLAEHGHDWVIDVFEGDNAGLIVAEVELAFETEALALPDWVGEEVTGDPRYLNANLVKHPFSDWSS